ncbi:hypothetical protein ISS07_05000 [Candidatus Woesearchaeota archaeon]|nr:hypothetical protein [Candidatus Woesearchaeota archaeon]
MPEIKIIREDGLERIIYEESAPNLIFGLNNVPSQEAERRSIGEALLQTGLEVYSTPENWPNDSYVQNNGLVIAEQDFGKLGHGGNYIFGDNFVLVSEDIKKELQKHLENNEHFKSFFGETDIVFVPPYSERIFGEFGNSILPKHLDLTVGYIPEIRRLFVEGPHYEQNIDLFEKTAAENRLNLNINPSEDGEVSPYLRNNFFSLVKEGTVFVIANRYDNPIQETGVTLIKTDKDIDVLPMRNHGSVKCATNIAPTTKLWDALGIEYKKYESKS